MERKLISINYEIPGYSDHVFGYNSDQTLLDADVIVFEPQIFTSSFGQVSFDESGTYDLKKNSQRWYSELSTALECGKTIFVILKKYTVATVHTGRKEFKGARTINYVENYSNYEFLPLKVPFVAATGSEILFVGHSAFSAFWNEFKAYLQFESYIDGKIKTPLFTTKTGGRPVGGLFNIGAGNLILIPDINYGQHNFLRTKKDGKQYWTKEAIQFGKKLFNSLLEIDKAVRSNPLKTPPPDWINKPQYVTDIELGLLKEKKVVSQNIEELLTAQKVLSDKIIKERQLKDLLFETGKSLEHAVTLAMQILGYSAENYHDGNLELDQIILSPEGQRFVGECEGKDKSAINIDKFRQLEENIQSDLRREGVDSPAIGILFGNGSRLISPKERPEQFTVKCLTSAKRGTILIKTEDLYPVVTYLKSKKNLQYAKSCRAAILSGIGSVVKFPPLPIDS